MRPKLPILALAFVLALGAGVALPACGDDDAPATTGANAASDATSPTASTSPGASQEDEIARAIVEGAYPSIAVWVNRYEAEWGSRPTTRWSARRADDGTWTATLTIDGGDDRRDKGTWDVRFPLDGGATPEQLRDAITGDERPATPRTSGAKRLSRTPKLSVSPRGPVALDVVVISVVAEDRRVTFDPAPAAATSTWPRSNAHARGLELLQANKAGSLIDLTVDDDIAVRVRNGQETTDSSFEELAAAAASGPVTTELRWRIRGKQPRSLSALTKQPVARITWTKP